MILIYSPMTYFLKEIETRLEPLGYPVFYSLPGETEPEPFVLIRDHTSTTGRTAKNNRLIEDISLQVDIYLPPNSRTQAEETRSKAVRLLGRRLGVESQIMAETASGREVYRIVLRIDEIIY